GDHFPLPVGIRSDDDFGGSSEQLLYDLELSRGGGSHLDFPMLRNDRQLLDRPALVLRAVAFRRRRFDQVTDAPGHHRVWARVTAVAALPGAEDACNVSALGRLLAQEQAHACAHPLFTRWDSGKDELLKTTTEAANRFPTCLI